MRMALMSGSVGLAVGARSHVLLPNLFASATSASLLPVDIVCLVGCVFRRRCLRRRVFVGRVTLEGLRWKGYVGTLAPTLLEGRRYVGKTTSTHRRPCRSSTSPTTTTTGTGTGTRPILARCCSFG